MKWSFLILLSITCLGCAEINRPKQLEDVDALIIKLESINKEIAKIHPKELNEMSVAFDSLVVLVSNIQPDSISLELAVKLDRYKSMAKGAVGVKEQYFGLIDLLKKRQNKVDQLKEDIELSRGHRDKYTEFIEFETEQLNKLQGRVDSCVLQVENSLLIYNELNASIVEDVMMLKKDSLSN